MGKEGTHGPNRKHYLPAIPQWWKSAPPEHGDYEPSGKLISRKAMLDFKVPNYFSPGQTPEACISSDTTKYPGIKPQRWPRAGSLLRVPQVAWISILAKPDECFSTYSAHFPYYIDNVAEHTHYGVILRLPGDTPGDWLLWRKGASWGSPYPAEMDRLKDAALAAKERIERLRPNATFVDLIDWNPVKSITSSPAEDYKMSRMVVTPFADPPVSWLQGWSGDEIVQDTWREVDFDALKRRDIMPFRYWGPTWCLLPNPRDFFGTDFYHIYVGHYGVGLRSGRGADPDLYSDQMWYRYYWDGPPNAMSGVAPQYLFTGLAESLGFTGGVNYPYGIMRATEPFRTMANRFHDRNYCFRGYRADMYTFGCKWSLGTPDYGVIDADVHGRQWWYQCVGPEDFCLNLLQQEDTTVQHVDFQTYLLTQQWPVTSERTAGKRLLAGSWDMLVRYHDTLDSGSADLIRRWIADYGMDGYGFSYKGDSGSLDEQTIVELIADQFRFDPKTGKDL
jgi:hypothetical protein